MPRPPDPAVAKTRARTGPSRVGGRPSKPASADPTARKRPDPGPQCRRCPQAPCPPPLPRHRKNQDPGSMPCLSLASRYNFRPAIREDPPSELAPMQVGKQRNHPRLTLPGNLFRIRPLFIWSSHRSSARRCVWQSKLYSYKHGYCYETYFSTLCAEAQPQPRFPCPYGYQEWP